MNRWTVASGLVLAVVFLAGTLRFFLATRPDGTPEVQIGADGRYHWAFLTSLALDRDLDLANQYADPSSGNYYEYTRTPTGRFANPFPIGPAIAWAPTFALADGVARIAEPARHAQGTSFLHQQITLYASFLYAFGAMILAFLLVRRRFGEGPALFGALAAGLGGPVLHYAIHQPSYAHAPSAFAVAALLWVWIEQGPARRFRGWLLLGALTGFAALVRAQNVVFAVPALAEGACLGWRVVRRRVAWRALLGPLAGAGVAILVFAPQLVVWKVLYGGFFGGIL